MREILLFAVVFVVGMVVSPALTHAGVLGKPANNLGLVGYWSFNEGVGDRAVDSSGRGNTGTLSGTPSWVEGKHGKALEFNGSSQFVSKTSPASFTTGTSARTLTGWVKASDMAAVRVPFAYGVCGVGNDGKAFGVYIAANEVLNFWGCGGSYDFSTGVTLSLNVWNHVAVTYDGTHVRVYINGVQAGSATARTMLSSTAFLQVGAASLLDVGNYYYSGLVDDVRVYTRALTASEIQNLYKAGEVRLSQVNRNGLLGEWHLDEGSGVRAQDSSGASATQVSLTGTPAWAQGKFGNSLSFTGSNYFGATLAWPSSGTISLWAYPTGFSDWIGPAGWKTGSPTNYALIDMGNAQRWRAVFKPNSTPAEVNVSSTATIQLNTWYHVSMTWSKSGSVYTVRLYVNGVDQGNTTWTGTALTDFGQFHIGNTGDYGDNQFQGRVDEVKVFNRALSASEIYALYNQSVAKINVDTVGNNPSLTSGLVGYWSFNGADVTDKVYDRVGGNNGYFIGGATSSAKTIGKVGQGVNFDGVNDYLVVSSIDLSSTNATSVSWWAKVSSFDNDNDFWFEMTTNTNSFTDGFFVVPDSGSTCVSTIYINLKGDVGNNGACYTRPSTSQWHHYVAIYDKSLSADEVNLYIDGQLQTPTSRTFSTTNNTNNFGTRPFYISSRGGSTLFKDGSLDEVRVYNRALSAAEVQALYLAGK